MTMLSGLSTLPTHCSFACARQWKDVLPDDATKMTSRCHGSPTDLHDVADKNKVRSCGKSVGQFSPCVREHAARGDTGHVMVATTPEAQEYGQLTLALRAPARVLSGNCTSGRARIGAQTTVQVVAPGYRSMAWGGSPSSASALCREKGGLRRLLGDTQISGFPKDHLR